MSRTPDQPDHTDGAEPAPDATPDEAARRHANKVLTYIEMTTDAVLVVDNAGRFLEVNPAACRMFGYTEDELLALTIPEVAPPDQAYQQESAFHFRRLLESGESQGEVHCLRKDGEIIVVDVHAVSVAENRHLGLIRDTTARRRQEDALRLADEVLNATSEGILITDAQQRIIRVNRAFREVTGYSEEEAIGQTPGLLKSGRHSREFYDHMWQRIRNTGGWQGEIWNRRKDGTLYPEYLAINVVPDRDGQPEHYVGVFTDITNRKQTEDRLLYLVHRDPLTGLANRTLLYERLGQAIARSRRTGHRVALLFFDLDGFKSINDTMGHDVGDRFLVTVAERLKRVQREVDTVARLGGDEFVVLIEDVDRVEDIGVLAERLVNLFRGPTLLDERELYVTISVGIAVAPDDGADPVALLRCADVAMYRAKEAGRNAYRFYESDMNARALDRLTLEADLRRAVERGELVLHYQPMFALTGEQPVAVEALVRWNHPTRGQIPPNAFIPLAEETGVIVEIGEWVLQEAIRQTSAWRSKGFADFRVAVNLSARQLRSDGLAVRIQETLADAGLPGEALALEITETVMMADPGAAAGVIEPLRAAGTRFLLDDFGTGYSSLSYLARFPLDGLKIDRSFVGTLPGSSANVAIVKTIIAMAHILGLQVTAEGVETQAQLSMLRDQNCDVLQGFLLSRPAPADEVTALLALGLPQGPLD